jgi:DNA-binding protein H-NS
MAQKDYEEFIELLNANNISLDDLIQNKQKANRDQDKADVKYLKRAQGAKTHVRREKTKK